MRKRLWQIHRHLVERRVARESIGSGEVAEVRLAGIHLLMGYLGALHPDPPEPTHDVRADDDPEDERPVAPDRPEAVERAVVEVRAVVVARVALEADAARAVVDARPVA